MTRSYALTRRTAVVLAVGTIVVGLAVHRLAPAGDARDIAGDALWAVMMFWWVTAIWPSGTTTARALAALAISWVVECSQLSHAAWLEQLRATRLGPLVLGTGFDPRDLVSYAVGIAVAWWIAKRAHL